MDPPPVGMCLELVHCGENTLTELLGRNKRSRRIGNLANWRQAIDSKVGEHASLSSLMRQFLEITEICIDKEPDRRERPQFTLAWLLNSKRTTK